MSNSNPKFISALSSAASSGTIGLSLETFDASTNITLTPSVSIVSGDDAEAIAKKLYTGINNVLISNSASYSGSPVFSNEDPNATFQLTRTNHVLCCWSQCQWQLKVTSNSTGALLKVGESPVLCTIQQAKDIAAIKGFSFGSLTDSQISDLLLQASIEVCSFLKSKLVLCTNSVGLIGNETKAIYLYPVPIASFDLPRIRRKAYIDIFTLPTYTSSNFTCNFENGRLNYRPNSVIVNMINPFGMDNEIQISFISGYHEIPEEIAWALVGISELYTTPYDQIKSLSGGSFNVTFDNAAVKTRIFGTLKKYRS
jgi:hypothetical protein